MSLINQTQTDILENLARFKFLVNSQMIPLLGKSAGYIRQQLALLVSDGYIKSYQLDRPGKAENMYFLTEAGKELIVSNEKIFPYDIKLPIGTPLIVKDYTHRKHMIDVQISLFHHLTKAGIHITEFMCYFDKIGANRKSGTLEAKTKIPLAGDTFFIPDGIMLTESDDGKSLYLIEMYCDRSTGRVIDQIRHKHLVAISLGTPAKKYDMAQNPVVLSAFENASVKDKAIQKLKEFPPFKHFEHLFFFASLQEIKTQGATAWKTINGVSIDFE